MNDSCNDCNSCDSCYSCNSCYSCDFCENLVNGFMCMGLTLTEKDKTKYWIFNKEVTKEQWDKRYSIKEKI